jgi:predicted dehydrogenase
MQAISTALLSFGMSGQVFHAPFIKANPHFHLRAVWERSQKLAAEKYPGTISYNTLEELLADKEIELVVVNTPNVTHYEYAKKALAAKKHIVVEKPFTVTVEQATELIDLAKEHGLMISVYQNRRYDSDYKIVKQVVDEGWLGNIVEAEFHYDRFKEELSPKLHKETPGPGTGALYDLGSHIIDQALQLFGFPDAVFADIRTVRPLSQVDDYFEVLLYYPGLRVRLHSSYLVREALPAYQLHGSKGSFIKQKTDVQEAALQAGEVPGNPGWGAEPEGQQGFLHTEKDGRSITEKLSSPPGNYGDYYEGIYQSLRNNTRPPVTAEEGLDVIRIIAAARKSSDERSIVDFK